MNKIGRTFGMLFLLVLGSEAWPLDEVVMIQAVSPSGKNFVIRLGTKDGIVPRQESLFTSERASFHCIAIEINRDYSLWKISDERGKIPFEKGDFVNFTRAVQDIWTELPKMILNRERIQFRPYHHWIVRGNFSLTLSEVVGKVDRARWEGRQGIEWEISYSRRFNYYLSWGAGFRFDREVSRLEEPLIDVISYRYLGTYGINYHFAKEGNPQGDFYLGVGVGFGLSNTRVEDKTAVGGALAFPIARFGHRYPLESVDLLFEISGNWLIISESFKGEPSQKTTLLNSRVSIGVKF